MSSPLLFISKFWTSILFLVRVPVLSKHTVSIYDDSNILSGCVPKILLLFNLLSEAVRLKFTTITILGGIFHTIASPNLRNIIFPE